MKHSLLVLAAAFALIAVGCKKETKPDSGEGSGQKYAVQFDVDNFEQSMEDFDGRIIVDGNTPNAKDSLLEKHVRFLYYVIYKDYRRYKRIIQRFSDPDFGTLKDSLPQGRYTLSVFGRKDSIWMPEEGYPNGAWSEAIEFDYSGEAFYKKLTINVDGELREKVKLSRVVAQININIKDKMPYNATTIELWPQAFPEAPWEFGQEGHFRFMNIMTGGYFLGDRNGIPYYPKEVRQIPEELRNTTNNTFQYTILMVDTTKLSLNFSVKDDNGKVLGSKKVMDIAFKPNRKITLSGNLFDALVQDSSGASIIINPEWRNDSIRIEF